MHPNVEYVRIQWRKTGVGEWINAWDIDWSSWEDITDTDGQLLEKNFTNFFNKYPFDGKESSRRKQMQELFKLDIGDADSQCATSRGAGCTLKWNLARQYFLSGLNDGSYEVRAKVFCSGYDSFATSEVRGSVTDEPLTLTVDLTPPEPISTHTLGRTFSISHTEPVRCPQLQPKSMPYKVTRVKDCDGNDVKNGEVTDEHVYLYFSFICMTDSPYSLVVKFPRDEKITPDGAYDITVNANAHAGSAAKVTDDGGNAIETRVFRVTIGDDCKVSRETSAKVSETKASELGLTYGQAKTNLSGAYSKMGIRLLGARLGFADDQTIVMRSSSIARVLLATVSMTACLVFVATRRLFARFDGSKVGNENGESEEKATLFGGKQPPHSTREFAYGSVI